MAVRKIGIISRTYRHVNRYRQILTVLFRYGFGDLVERLRIAHYIEIGLQFVTREKHEETAHLSTAERTRKVLEELGPTFIKLGQVLSTRPDLIPEDFANEFAKLQQHVPPFPFENVRAIIEADLKKPLDQLYESFDEEPIAAASIGQVHRARQKDGEDVVIKVRRPGIEEMIETDLEILMHLTSLAEKHLDGWEVYQPSRIVEEFSRVISRELDFTTEAAHLERFAAQFANDRTIYVPKVFRTGTTERVLTLEYVDVIPVHNAPDLRARGLDPVLIARRGADLTLKQIFVHGFFHADPHPGNVFALPGNVLCLLDFGMMGRLDRQTREHFADLVYAIANRDPQHVASTLFRITERANDEVDIDVARLERDVAEFIDINIPTSLGNLDFGKLLHELLTLVARHHLFTPPDIVTMLKAAATVERLGCRLDPTLNMVAAARPYVERLKVARFMPTRIIRDMFDVTGDLLHVAGEIPSGLRDLLRQSKRGRLRIGFEHRGLEDMIHSHERIANRVSFAIVVAALIVGSSLIVHSKLPPTWNDIPIIGLVGFLVAGVMGFTLLIAIIRHGRL